MAGIVQSPAHGSNVALDQILTGPSGLIHKMNRIRPAAGIVVKCGPTDNHLTTYGLPGKNFGHPCLMVHFEKACGVEFLNHAGCCKFLKGVEVDPQPPRLHAYDVK